MRLAKKMTLLLWMLTVALFVSTAFTAGPDALKIVAVTASSDDGNVPANTIDNDNTTRWSAQGDGQWIKCDLGEVKKIGYIGIAFHKGNLRETMFEIEVSADDKTWKNLGYGKSNGKDENMYYFDFEDLSARYVKFVGHINTGNNWNSLLEVAIFKAGKTSVAAENLQAEPFYAVTPKKLVPLTDKAAIIANTPALAPPFQIPADLPDNLVYYHDVEIGKGGDKVLKIEIVAPKNKPAKPLPVLAYIHGGGWNKGHKDEHARKIMGYARDGYVGVSIQYRLTDVAIFPGQLEDCKLAIRYLRANAAKYHINPDKIGVWGSSAGSHLAALLGTTGDVKELEGNGGWPGVSSRVQAVVDWYGPADFTTEFANNYSSVTKLLGVKAFADPEKAKRAMPGTYASKDDPPFLVMHGNQDTTIPYTDSVVFSEALKKAGVDVTFIIVDGAGHGFKDFPQATVTAEEFLAKHLQN